MRVDHGRILAVGSKDGHGSRVQGILDCLVGRGALVAGPDFIQNLLSDSAFGCLSTGKEA